MKKQKKFCKFPIKNCSSK